MFSKPNFSYSASVTESAQNQTALPECFARFKASSAGPYSKEKRAMPQIPHNGWFQVARYPANSEACRHVGMSACGRTTKFTTNPKADFARLQRDGQAMSWQVVVISMRSAPRRWRRRIRTDSIDRRRIRLAPQWASPRACGLMGNYFVYTI